MSQILSRALDAPSIYGADGLSLQRVEKLEQPREMPELAPGKRWLLLDNAPAFVTAPWVNFILSVE